MSDGLLGALVFTGVIGLLVLLNIIIEKVWRYKE